MQTGSVITPIIMKLCIFHMMHEMYCQINCAKQQPGYALIPRFLFWNFLALWFSFRQAFNPHGIHTLRNWSSCWLYRGIESSEFMAAGSRQIPNHVAIFLMPRDISSQIYTWAVQHFSTRVFDKTPSFSKPCWWIETNTTAIDSNIYRGMRSL